MTIRPASDQQPEGPGFPVLGRAEILQFVLVVLLGTLFLGAAIVYYDNVHRGTSNGLWKSNFVAQWVDRTPGRQTEPGNLVYFPVEGVMVRCLPAELFGPVWRRMAFVNAIFGATALGMTYLLARRLFNSTAVAIYTTLFQVACAFFLLLATINEDIMPGYAWFITAVACAVLTAQHQTRLALFVTAQCLALSWLFHSSLQLPGLGAFLLALWWRGGPLAERIRRSAFFLVCLVPLPVVCALVTGLKWNRGLWAKKGLGTGWGGFALEKFGFMWSGIAQYFAGGQNVISLEKILQRDYELRTGLKWLVLTALAAVFVRECRRRSGQPEWRMAAVLLGSVFVLGEFMNLYIQPQDPQMQIQPMAWLPFAGGTLGWVILRQPWGRAGLLVQHTLLVAGIGALLVGNVQAYAALRHEDSRVARNLEALEKIGHPEKTVFLLHGFEPMGCWLTAIWRRGVTWPNEPQSKLNPARDFKVIYVAAEATEFPKHSVADSAASVVNFINRAMDEGYGVIAADIWAASDQEWVSSFSTVCGPEKPLAIHKALQENFEGAPAGTIPDWGSFYRISKKAGR